MSNQMSSTSNTCPRHARTSQDSQPLYRMAESALFLSTKRVAVVTGANKGIGLEICRQLASKGVMVVLTARDQKKGIEAVQSLKARASCDNVIFHQLDVGAPSSIASLADFIKTRFGKLDILVNNAAVLGVKVDSNALDSLADHVPGGYINWNEVSTQAHDLAEECLKTNYYGPKSTTEAFAPLLKLSDSGRVVNVSSSSGKLKFVANDWAQTILSDADCLTEDRIDEVLNEFLKDFKEGFLNAKGWPSFLSAYTLSKAALNAYTRIVAKKYPELTINCVCPGYVKTDMNYHRGVLSSEEGAESPVWLALLPPGEKPSGLFFSQKIVSPFYRGLIIGTAWPKKKKEKKSRFLVPAMTEAKRYAIVTGANKGIGFEVCRHLASKGITVVLTARDEKRGLDALHKLKFSDGLSADRLLFHQLDVADSSSVASLAQFIKTHFGRLDILVNNAGIIGADIDSDAFKAAIAAGAVEEERANKVDWSSSINDTHELAVQCFQTNYYGAKRMIEAFVPLLQLSQSPRVVNVSSGAGKLKNIPSEWARGIFTDVDNLTDERVDEVLNQYLKDLKEGSKEAKGWPSFLSAYTVSKAAMNAYTIVVAKKHPNIKINSVCPGFVKTDINFESGTLTVEEGADSIVRLALLPDDGPSGLFFIRSEISPLG
ncbi:uncharacterized protein [Coffea arabica]|uniref:(+)-neomenthol dehydrogenase-like n=1 Tax=Coffea arabica TaxID=13443 RepID=A0A6P6VKZ7_COFAR